MGRRCLRTPSLWRMRRCELRDLSVPRPSAWGLPRHWGWRTRWRRQALQPTKGLGWPGTWTARKSTRPREGSVIQAAGQHLRTGVRHLRRPPEDAAGIVPHQVGAAERRPPASPPQLCQCRGWRRGAGSHGAAAGRLAQALLQRARQRRDRIPPLFPMTMADMPAGEAAVSHLRGSRGSSIWSTGIPACASRRSSPAGSPRSSGSGLPSRRQDSCRR